LLIKFFYINHVKLKTHLY